MIDSYDNDMIAVFSVNCTTVNQEFNPNDSANNKLFDFDPIRYMCLGGSNTESYCNFKIWIDDATAN